MGSELKLKNQNGTNLSIVHRDGQPAKTIYTDGLTIAVDTVADMEALVSGVDTSIYDGNVCFVKDLDRGGYFIYDSTKASEDNQGTNFKGFIRQYDGYINVKWFGAKDTNIIGYETFDSTSNFKDAIIDANSKGRVVYVPKGTYKITDTLVLCTSFDGVSLIGQDKKTVVLKSYIDDTTKPLLDLIGGSGKFNNVKVTDMTLLTNNDYVGTAIHLNGIDNSSIERIEISKFNYGLWLHNENAGAFTEVNNFNDVVLQYCNNGIRMEKGRGNDSFHGNNFNDVYMNIGNNQIGFNLVSGYYYNGRFSIFMWCSTSTGTLINASANCEHCIGDITYEVSDSPKITGSGRFWFKGNITGIGSFTDATTRYPERSMACDNYIQTNTHNTLGYSISSMYSNDGQYQTTDVGLYALTGTNVKSTLLTGYKYGNNATLYLGEVGYKKSVKDSSIGLAMTYSGSSIKTYNSSGLDIITSDNNTALSVKNGRFGGNPGKYTSLQVEIGDSQTITLNDINYENSNLFFIITIRITGDNFEYRKIYAANHQGFGGNGVLTELASGYMYDDTDDNVKINSVSLDSSANLKIDLDTDRVLDIYAYSNGVGVL